MCPAYSILIPSHNAVRWVLHAVDSALGQTARGGETIVADDGSTDESQRALASLGDQIQFLRRPNRGGNPTRNELLSLASNNWVQFLDADDYLLPTKIETQFAEASDLEPWGNMWTRSARPWVAFAPGPRFEQQPEDPLAMVRAWHERPVED